MGVPLRLRLLTQEHFVAIEVFEKHARAPRARFRLAMKCDPSGLQGLVVTDTIGSVERNKWEAARLLAHHRQVLRTFRQLEPQQSSVAGKREGDPASVAKCRVFYAFEAELLRVELNDCIVVPHQQAHNLDLSHDASLLFWLLRTGSPSRIGSSGYRSQTCRSSLRIGIRRCQV